jgi:hypothetical protein
MILAVAASLNDTRSQLYSAPSRPPRDPIDCRQRLNEPSDTSRLQIDTRGLRVEPRHPTSSELSNVWGSGAQGAVWIQGTGRICICAPPYIAVECMVKRAGWSGMNHGTQVDMRGWLQEIAAHAFGCQIVCVGSQIPVPVCLLLWFCMAHRASDAQSWLAVRLNHAAGACTLVFCVSPRTCHI